MIASKTPRIRSVPFLGLLVCLLGVGCAAPIDQTETSEDRHGDVIYQVATLNSLLKRKFEGTETVGGLMRRGTLGLGTVSQLDGEMVIVDGTAYAVRDDGTTDKLDEGTRVPFGVVTSFDVDTTLTLNNVESFADFQSRLDEKLPSMNQLYALRVTGEFDYLQTRSVTAQQPPYPTLENVIANQTRFTFEGTAGTIVGFHVPDVFEGVNAVGCHAHFVTTSRDGGGHLLDVRSSELKVQIDRASSIQVTPLES